MNLPQEIAAKVKEIRPLSPSTTRLMQTVADERHTAADAARIVEHDPGLTALTLKLINSSAFGLRTPVDTVSRAVAYLGDKMIMGVALRAAAPRIYSEALPSYAAACDDLWLHSMRAAIAARMLARLANSAVNPEQAFTAAILHDIGKALLADHLIGQGEAGAAVLETAEQNDFLDLERTRSGTDHTEVGAALASHWKLPEALVQAIRHHHAPSNAQAEWRPLSYVIHLADILAMLGGTGTGSDTLAYSLDEGFAEHVPLTDDTLYGLLLDIDAEFEKTRAIFS